MTWKNAKRLKLKLSRLPKTIEIATREAMESLADQIVALMQSLVPVDTGALRDSISWCWGSPPTGSSGILTISRSSSSAGINSNKITVFAGNEDAFWARWVEFGTQERAPGSYRDKGGKRHNAGARGHAATRAQPFFYPSWRAFKRKIPRGISVKVNRAIKQLARGQSGDGT